MPIQQRKSSISSLDPLQTAAPYSTRSKLLDGSISVTAQRWPHFLYDSEEYDVDDMDKGLTRGYVLVRVSVIIQHVLYSG
jgi:hypothetical protein